MNNSVLCALFPLAEWLKWLHIKPYISVFIWSAYIIMLSSHTNFFLKTSGTLLGHFWETFIFLKHTIENHVLTYRLCRKNSFLVNNHHRYKHFTRLHFRKSTERCTHLHLTHQRSGLNDMTFISCFISYLSIRYEMSKEYENVDLQHL